VKNVCMKVSYESLKNVFPKEHESLLNYVNKYMVRKMAQTPEEKKVNSSQMIVDNNNKSKNNINSSKINLNHSFIDNTDLDFDEEEEFISKEFKKTDKKQREDEKKFLDRIESLQLNEDPDFAKPKPVVQVDKKLEAIEKLFKTDKVDLVNHFYVNPYATGGLVQKPLKEGNRVKIGDPDEQGDDVYFDQKKGKLFVSFDNKKKEEKKDKINKKRPREESLDNDNVKKMKTNKQTGHIIKYSGDEYKSKRGKGDVLIKGKADPFAYIQLNPKTTSRKNRKEGLKTFKTVMEKSGKGSIMGGLKISK